MRSHSAGGVVLNPHNQVALVQHSQTGNWSFPKGHLEEGETPEDAALREIAEEAGVTEVELIRQLGSYERQSYDGKEEKTITLFLGRTNQMDTQPRDPDIGAVKWVGLMAVAEVLSNPTDAEFFVSMLPSIEDSSNDERNASNH